MTRLRCGFANLQVNRDPRDVAARVAGLLEAEDLDWLAVCESWQYAHDLARIPGYDYLTSRGKGPGGRDAGHLIRHGVPHHGYRLARTRTTWPRDKGPGQHWSRDFPHVEIVGWCRAASVHWPRNQDANRAAIAACWARLAVLLTVRRGPWAAPGDWNQGPRRRGLFTPGTLAKVTGCRTIGRGILHLHYRVVRVYRFRTGPTLGGDHETILYDLEQP